MQSTHIRVRFVYLCVQFVYAHSPLTSGRPAYHQPAAFTTFVRGGGNVALYQRLSERLARRYDEFAEGSAEHLRSLVTRCERGIAEYGEDAHLVARGFLLPVLLGQVTPDGGRTNWEQPAERWAEHLADAGFRDITVTPFAEYWWAPAVLVTACSRA